MADLKKRNTVTKKRLITEISKEQKMHPKDVKLVLQAALDKVVESLANGDRLEIRNFGVFETVDRKGKIGRNPKEPEKEIPIPPRKAVKFSPGKEMKEKIGRKFPPTTPPPGIL